VAAVLHNLLGREMNNTEAWLEGKEEIKG